MWQSEPYRAAVAIQRVLSATALNPETEPRDVAQAARAFCELEETKRRIRMKPLPKSIDVEARKNPQRAQAREPSFTDPSKR